MKYPVRVLIIICLILGISACDGPSKQWANHPPTGAKVINAPDVKVGDTWEFKANLRGAATSNVHYEKKVYKILKNGEYQAIYTNKLNGKRGLLYYHRDGHRVAYWNPEDKRRARLDKVAHSLQFPLWIGKRWKITVKDRPYSGGHLYNFTEEFVVTSYETVQTAMGPYQGFKIERYTTVSSDQGSGYAEFWYVPQLKAKAKFRIPGKVDIDLIRFTPGN